MKFYIKSSSGNKKNFTNPSSLSEGMQIREESDGPVLTVKSSVKKGNAWEVTFDNGDCFLYDPNEQFEVVTAATNMNKNFDVFMLMDYHSDTSPDTIGMEGDTFDCLGKFFATDLETAKKELADILEQHPELKEVCPGLYVSEYVESFDSPTREEQDEYGNPYDVDNNVFGDLQALVDYCFDWDYINSWAQGTAEDDELPFSIEEDIPEDNFLRNCLNKALDIVELDPDYADDIATIRYNYNMPNATYDIVIYFEDGDSLEYSFDTNKIIKLDDDQVSDGARIIADELYAALDSSGR